MSVALRPPVAMRVWVGICLVLTAFNLRPVFSSLSAVLPEVMRDTGSGPAIASLLTTFPVMCLGLFAPFAPPLAVRFGAERVVVALLAALAIGTSLRAGGSFAAIFAGSVLAGAAIAFGNVLLPGLVKRDFPDRTALMTGLYSMAMCGGAALAAGATVPLAATLGGSWRAALAVWTLPVLVALAAWVPPVLAGAATRGAIARRSGPIRLWREPLAWQVTVFMGLQSALAYSVFGWLAPILRERGLDPVTAGLVVSVSIFTQVAASLFAPWAATRSRDQRAVAISLLGAAVAGLLGMLFGPLPTVWGFAVLQGIGQGALFSVAMIVIIMRAPDPETVARLSGMAQGIGYVLAGFGPLLVGAIRSWSGGFAATAPLFLGLGLAAAAGALGAGRDRVLGGSRGVRPAAAPSP